MNWDDVTLIVLASCGLVTLLLTQINDVLDKVPQTIRALRRIRRALRDGTESEGHEASPEAGDR
ncbi:hypothetical protein [Streptomyces sp. Rer75]|uniref:hypothetical protein n=1 Tax=Streptomyces sp. Rer75 TaxID=2750011 RepID=UPI0015D0482A|nr:hypothetical protein [Streptomyces sp. Rer75]QLH21295.1 hypothetical protein HYQ63_12200 [Streptomyces sp. Rer75]